MVLGIGIIGCGGMGANWSRILNTQFKDVKVAAVCDVELEKARALGNELGVPFYADYDGILKREDVNVIWVGTPNYTHADIVVKSASAGKHIFCEKPMALSVRDCDRMIDAAKKTGVKLAVGHSLRFNRLVNKAKEMLDSGLMGHPISVSATRIFGRLGAGWRSSFAMSGGPLFEVQVHEIDLMRYLCGDIQSVYALGGKFFPKELDYEDTYTLSLLFEEGTIGSLLGSTSSHLYDFHVTLLCDKGTILLSFAKEGILTYRIKGGSQEVIDSRAISGEDQNVAEAKNFLAAIIAGKEPIVNGVEGRKAIEIAQAALESMKRRTPISLPLKE